MGLHNLYLRANSKQRSEIFTEVCPNARLDEVMELQSEAARAMNMTLTETSDLTITDFVRTAYWQRGWIIQEATANNNTYIWHGPARYRIASCLGPCSLSSWMI
jgi:hypothetical protein